MQTRENLSRSELEDMRAMLADLTPAERATLLDPDFITEDEADIIRSNRAMKEPGPSVPAEEIFAKYGYNSRRHRP